MRLVAGTSAPDCTFSTLRGTEESLSSLRGTPVWVSFSRFAACPLCNYEIHRIRGEWENRFQGISFRHFRVMQSPMEKLHEFVATKDPPFDLVADPEMHAYRAFEVERSILKMFTPSSIKVGRAAAKAGFRPHGSVEGPVTRVPADFLIDQGGVIRVAYYGAHIADHVPLDVVSDFLAGYAERAG